MSASLNGKTVAVIGASRGVGREIVRRAASQGARVLAAARSEPEFTELATATPGLEVLALDAAAEDAPERVFQVMVPDLLILAIGARPPTSPVHELTWTEFSRPWNTDTKAAFHFGKAALLRPLPPGGRMIVMSSGAAIGGSPISGGYAAAKRMEMFLARYFQKEADRLGRELQFTALAPGRIMPQTQLGAAAVAGYARYLGVTAEAFIAGMPDGQTPEDVAEAAIALATRMEPEDRGASYMVTAKGMTLV